MIHTVSPPSHHPFFSVNHHRNEFRVISIICAWLAVGLGICVMGAWYLYSPEKYDISIRVFNMQFNTALMFVASGLGLRFLLAGQRIWVSIAAVMILAFSGAMLLEYIIDVNVGIDELFVDDVWHPGVPYPGRMSPNTCVAFFLTGLFFIAGMLLKQRNVNTTIQEICSFLVFILGAAGMAGHLQLIEEAYSWGSFTLMSIHTAGGFMVLAFGLMNYYWWENDRYAVSIPLWIPGLLCFLLLMFDFAMPQGVATGISYMPLVFCSLWFARPQTAFVMAVVASLLIIFGYIISDNGTAIGWHIITNRIMAILAVWLVATLIYLQRSGEMARKTSEEKLRAIVENAVDGLITIDAEGRIESFNVACERIFGYNASEVIGCNIKMLMPLRYSREHDGYLRNYRTTRQAKIIGTGREVAGLRKDGSEFPIDLSVSEIFVDGKQLFSGILRDITYRKALEEEKEELIRQLHQSNTHLEQFAYICSHDLQEPLRMISNFTQRLEKHLGDEHLDGKARHYMQYIVNGSTNARALINDVLQLARIGNETRRLEVVDCEEVLATVVHNLRERIKENNVQITHDGLPSVQAHFTYVVQIFQNLISNAIKFHNGEQPAIHISAKKSGSQWQLSIKDNGIGIAPEHQQKVFQIFQRLHSRAAYPGTGIGLTIVQRIIQQYDGEIWLESVAGKGTTFYFTLPDTGENHD